jgi:heme/copper-type cytochrome/quinol oxidase subunit 1
MLLDVIIVKIQIAMRVVAMETDSKKKIALQWIILGIVKFVQKRAIILLIRIVTKLDELEQFLEQEHMTF